jgi:hypothetical protein
MVQEGPLAATTCQLILMVHDAFLSAAMAKGRGGMRQHLARQMHRPKQMHGRTAHPPPHEPPEARRQLQDALMIDMSMQAAPAPTPQSKNTAQTMRCIRLSCAS